MSTPRETVLAKQQQIDQLASIVFSHPMAVSGDWHSLSYRMRELIENTLERIAKRKERPEEH